MQACVSLSAHLTRASRVSCPCLLAASYSARCLDTSSVEASGRLSFPLVMLFMNLAHISAIDVASELTASPRQLEKACSVDHTAAAESSLRQCLSQHLRNVMQSECVLSRGCKMVTMREP